MAACRALLRHGSRSFFTASLLLPRRVREPASVLYAFCRLADDAVDIESRQDALSDLRERLRLAYLGRPLSSSVDRALAQVVEQHDIPRALPEALLQGLAWDAAGVRFETLGHLEEYAARVAGSVGAMMAILMQRRQPDVLARACDLGVAMQLTNIARDVGEDARIGRLYLPGDWMRDAGLDPDRWLARPRFDSALGSVLARLLAAADRLYNRAGTGVDQLPLFCRPGIHAARLIYSEIGRQVARQGHDSVSRRAVVPASRKAALVAGALAASCLPRRLDLAAPLESTGYLVLAAARPAPASTAPRWHVTRRMVWLLELFERLERREQA